MISVAEPDEGQVRGLAFEDLTGCLALSRAANWNQNAADWTLMLREGKGWGIELPDPYGGAPVLAGSIIALPFRGGVAGDFAWLSMVLVLPDFAGRGFATRLLAEAFGWLRRRGLPAVLDATPQGEPVYRRIGMAAHWGFRRYRREARPGVATDRAGSGPATGPAIGSATGPATGPAAGVPASRPIVESDWAVVLAADRPAFGANRSAILRDLASRRPPLARVVAGDNGLRGYLFGRDGREATQFGPLWAADAAAAERLLTDAFALVDGPIYLDLADRHRGHLPFLAAAGFVEQRPFTRMTLDLAAPPGDPRDLVLMAGPELG